MPIWIDQEIKSIVKDKNSQNISKDIVENVVEEVRERKMNRKCKFFNVGFCKYKQKDCTFLHPENLCKEYVKNLKCEIKNCSDNTQEYASG